MYQKSRKIDFKLWVSWTHSYSLCNTFNLPNEELIYYYNSITLKL